MTRARPVRFAALAAVVAAALWTPRCGRPSDELAIRALIEDSVKRVERRDARGLIEFFAPDYHDFEGRDPAGTLELVSD